VLVAIYMPAVHSAYRIDDFAWLSLRNTITHGHSLWWALFSPQAQGTIRPLGDRLWFLLASSWFGLNPTPLHAFALCAQIAVVYMVVVTGRRLLGSGKAAVLAALLWVINPALVEPIVWASAVNEVLHALWFLIAFDAFLRWVESRRPLWLGLQVIALVLALGAVELAVTFPFVAAAWILLSAGKSWQGVLPSAAVVFAFTAAHFRMVRLPSSSSPYHLMIGWNLFANLWHYWTTVLGPAEYQHIHGTGPLLTGLATAILSGALLFWGARCARRARMAPFFCLLWFAITLAPTLPLMRHQIDYYGFLPSIGLAWLAADAITGVVSWRGRSLAIACAALYAACQIPSTLFARDFALDLSRDVVRRESRLLEGVREIRANQPRNPVFLAGIDYEQFWWGLCYGELTRRGFTDLHVLPDAADHGVPIPPKEWCLTTDFQFSPDETARMLRASAREYDISQLPPKPVVTR